MMANRTAAAAASEEGVVEWNDKRRDSLASSWPLSLLRRPQSETISSIVCCS